MKHGLLAMILSASVGLAGMVASHDVQAAPTKGAKKDDKKDEKKAEPGKLEAAPKLTPPGLEFKMSPKKVYEVYDKAIEKDYVKKYKEVEPGIQMQRLDYEKSQFKQAFRLSYLDLKNRPSTLDGTKLATEFTYGNDEGVMQISRKGKHRYLFFIKQQLWNIVDVYKLGGNSKWGGDFKTASERLEKMLGAPGKHVDADPDNGQPYEMLQWTDGKIWLRAMNHDKKLAISYVDVGMLAKLTELRKKSEEQKKDEIDPSVKSVLRNNKKDESEGKKDDKKKR